MNKTININLGGFAFQIEEDAYNLLQNYLQKIETKLGNGEEASEVISDVEFRIAELFKADTKTNGGVIVLEAVQSVIKLVGEPEAFVYDENDEAAGEKPNDEKQQEPTSEHEYKATGKTLFRDINRKVFGGVCSGLALYLSIDPVVLRLIFALVFYFFQPIILVYIVLWIAMPKPRTVEQWFEMKGGQAYFQQEGEEVKYEYSKDSKHEYSKTSSYPKNYHSRDYVATGLRSSGNVLSVIVGLILSVVSFLWLVGMVVFLLFQNSTMGEIIPDTRFIYELPHRLLNPDNIALFSLSLGILVGIPLLVVFYLGLRLIFRFQSKDMALGLIALVIWFAGLGLFFYETVDYIKGYKESAKITIEKELQPIPSDTLYINTMKNSGAYRRSDFLMDMKRIDLYASNDGQLILEGKPRIYIVKGDFLKVIVVKKARGLNEEDAIRNAEFTEYYWQQNDSVILLDKYFTLGDQALIRNQEVTITIQVPVNIKVKVSPDLEYLVTEESVNAEVITLSQADIPEYYRNKSFNFINRNL